MSDNEPDKMDHLMTLANQVSRSSVAIVDAMTQRGAFKGEELSTIGQLRDQCIQIIQMAETNEQEKAQAADDGDAS